MPNVSLFLSRFCKKKFLVSRFRFCQQIPSADFCCQQIFFLSADSISKFLSSADFFFVSKCLCRRHLNDAHAGIVRFAPACFLTEKFSPSAGAHFRFYHDSIRFAGPSSTRRSVYIFHLLSVTSSLGGVHTKKHFDPSFQGRITSSFVTQLRFLS